jgi:hypothetical protein
MSCLKTLIAISEQSTHILQLNIKVLVKMFFEQTILRQAILEQTIITTYSFRTNYFRTDSFRTDSFRTYLLVQTMRSPDEDIGSINDV